MRLIDADKLKDAINSSLNTGRETFPAEVMYEAIDEQPTAYDVDKVVKQLEDEKELAYADFERYAEEVDPCLDSECDDFFHKGLGRAIKVLKVQRKE